ncbi:MAG: methyltransferase domain-containing protein [Cytophagales bacterium]|nr:methyltransferase domain-containing protein [Bernardetiaceae bacterium]MDW8205567.1 methyltransferase domain-containing protein [Cytophagales bacterium]
MPHFSRRSYQPELMDDLTLDSQALATNLRELEYINTYLGGNAVALKGLKYFVARSHLPLSVADVGCGGGDTLRCFAQWAHKKRIDLQLTGYDANPFMIRYAESHPRHLPIIRYRCMDLWSEEFGTVQHDVFVLSLFCHHFTDEQLAQLLPKLLQQARKGIIINDLHRHPLAYYGIGLLTRMLRGSYLVQHDAPLSVLRAFRRHELEQLLQPLAPHRWQISWHWAFRYLVLIEKAGNTESR